MGKQIGYCIAMGFLCGCVSSVNVLKSAGDTVTLMLADKSEYRVELLAVSDSTVYISDQTRIGQVAFSDVRKIHIHGYRINRGPRVVAVTPALLLELGIFWVAGSVDETGWQVATAAAAAGTVVAAVSGGPKADFSRPFHRETLDFLRRYCRYPQGLDDGQWQMLLTQSGQATFWNPIEESSSEPED